MKQFTFAILSVVFLFGQESMGDGSNPCEDPLLTIAENEGIKAIPITISIKIIGNKSIRIALPNKLLGKYLLIGFRAIFLMIFF